MSKVFKNLNWKMVLVYIDDILVFSKNFQEHLDHLQLVFQKLREAGLTLKPSKCQFAAKRILFLGHYISKQGIEVNPDKVKAVKTFPTPKTVKEVKAYLGLTGWYRRFIKNYSGIVAPLHKLLCKENNFVWTEECEKAFQTLKEMLTKTPILKFPDMSKEFILTTDASDIALGYILGQKDDEGRETVICYGGRSIRKTERSYLSLIHISEPTRRS